MAENSRSSRAKKGAEVAEQQTTSGGSWSASPEAKSKALTFRIIAAVLWAIAIGGELFAIFWVLRQDPILMWLLIVMLVAIGAFALGGSLLWKKANRLDPASRKDTVRFFVQNQLGVIITVIAFLPLIVMIFLNKDMDGKQKGIAGGIAIVIAAAVGLASADWNPPSVEQYSVETNVVKELTGKDEVVWVKGGSAFHVCEDVPDLRRSTKTKEHTSVADAHAGNIPRLTKKWVSEAINNCGYTAADVDRVLGEVDDVKSTLDDDQFIETSGTPEVKSPAEKPDSEVHEGEPQSSTVPATP
ncbi:hypothetical protein JVX90_10895 [Gordonia sp. PDNC005]|uniref:hypothetical protein n=1 Tax=unclassified Gordonia (in: high G+C Gram-positive bacteria) TaxID=2657482 RepID=UPI0019639B60|nr:hypothetical protein [Gordonia sp. PDNC005]QRY60963.1 hypothetical protein JVX90_10895 [Gordonia sp. PDNC005]